MRSIHACLGSLLLLAVVSGCTDERCNPSNCQLRCEATGHMYGNCDDSDECQCSDDPPPDRQCPPTCPDGFSREGDSCVAGCGTCESGTECISGACIPPAGPYPGMPCGSPADCPPGSTCEVHPLVSDGTMYCMLICDADEDCPAGSPCFMNLCARACNPDFTDPCGSPVMTCYTPPDVSTGVCAPPCDTFDLMDPCILFSSGTCEESTGTCSDTASRTCTGGERICHEDHVLECATDGMSYLCIERCASSGQICAGGECVDGP